ncbi:cysteine desulfurase NifS [Mycobacterium sp. MS1601]|uniref:cysteine desulfurase family protein n=1 Tax=Mycobacterium sp. MS1601 TaxID=1936029 RepID=UPI0009790FD4|nr:cysteine desulfurase family protein [Mycobacterium sp. MS1601]AQA01105.1 cysteine desulfurase NifS [Mycobacterium sp. MS1601]
MSPAKPVYLDHAATTPMHPAAIEAMTAVLSTVGNASSLHTAGRQARRRMEEARETLAGVLGARPSEVIFTAGGTESDNLAIKGIYWARHDADPARTRIITTAVEHHAVLDAVTWLAEHEGAEVVFLPTEADGSVTAASLREVLTEQAPSVALVTVMWANNEVGTLFPVAELAAVAAEFDVPMHSDAIQAVGQVPVRFADSGLSAMSVTAHKFGGPTGVGALLLRRDVGCVPLTHGGGQERDVRSGTSDVAGAVAMATAAEISVAALDATSARLLALRERLIDGVLAEIDDVVLNGARESRLPGNAHFTFRGCEGDSLLMLLDANGIECSTGSACTAGVAQPSHVLIAMGADATTARGSIRLSLGHTSVESDVDAALEVLPAAVARARQAALASAGVVR